MESKFNMKATAGTKQDFKKRVDGVGLKDNVTGHWILIAEAMGEPAITLNCWTITRQILVGEKKKKKVGYLGTGAGQNKSIEQQGWGRPLRKLCVQRESAERRWTEKHQGTHSLLFGDTAEVVIGCWKCGPHGLKAPVLLGFSIKAVGNLKD